MRRGDKAGFAGIPARMPIALSRPGNDSAAIAADTVYGISRVRSRIRTCGAPIRSARGAITKHLRMVQAESGIVAREARCADRDGSAPGRHGDLRHRGRNIDRTAQRPAKSICRTPPGVVASLGPRAAAAQSQAIAHRQPVVVAVLPAVGHVYERRWLAHQEKANSR